MPLAYLSERENIVEQINSICMSLFETWCQTRNVTALAYLMHCWPMIDSTPTTLRRLGESMRDLRRYHAGQLDKEAFQALCDIAELIDDLIGPPVRTVRLMVVGEISETYG